MKRVKFNKAGGRPGKVGGFVVLFAMLMLITLTSMGMIVSDIAIMEVGLGSSDYFRELARTRAWSCTPMFLHAVASQKLPSPKLKNLDSDMDDGTPDPNTVECVVPGMIVEGGAEKDGEGGAKIGKLTADLFSTDYYFTMILFKSIGFGGKGCGSKIVSGDDGANDIYNVLSPGETATGIIHEQELGITYGPCKEGSEC